MKHLKILWFAGLLASVAILSTAAPASATVLCASNTSQCGSIYAGGTEIKASLKAGVNVAFASTFGLLECGESTISGKTKNAGGVTATVTGMVESITFASCTCPTVKVLKTGEFEFHASTTNGDGTFTSKGAEFTFTCDGISCIFTTGTGTELGSVTGGPNASIWVKASLAWAAGDDKQSACASTGVGKMLAEYIFTSPTPMYVEPF